MKGKIVLLMMVVFAVSLSLVAAAPSGATTAEGASSSGGESNYTNVSIDGGDVTYVDVSTTAKTSRWAGFFGNVSANIVLADSGANSFYEWTVSTSLTDAVVYAASGTISDWTDGNIAALTNAEAPAFVNGSYTDNFTETFSASEGFTSNSITEASTPYVTTFNSSGVAGNLKTYALYSAADAADIWAGKAVDDTNAFDGSSVDYQILVPAQTGTTYYFYMELP